MSAYNLWDQLAVDVSQAPIAPVEEVSQALMVDADGMGIVACSRELLLDILDSFPILHSRLFL